MLEVERTAGRAIATSAAGCIDDSANNVDRFKGRNLYRAATAAAMAGRATLVPDVARSCARPTCERYKHLVANLEAAVISVSATLSAFVA